MRLPALLIVAAQIGCARDVIGVQGDGAASDSGAAGHDSGDPPGPDDADRDGDGTPDRQDCAPDDPTIHPDAVEVCDGVDNDCDRQVDEGPPPDAATWHPDADGDGFGDPAVSLAACDAPEGYVADATDCDDDADHVNPGADEVCDPIDADEDCDGLADDADDSVAPERTWYRDRDRDSYGDRDEAGVAACDDPSTAGARYAAEASDCDDTNATISPGAQESCDGIDNDCDGVIDLCPAPPTSLGSADSRLLGESAGDQAGASVRVVPDLNGDGRDELVVGAPEYSGALYRQGRAYVVYGPATGATALSDADVLLTGTFRDDRAGYRVAGGDANGDGVGDLLVSSWKADTSEQDAGVTYLLLGPLSGAVDLHRDADGMAWGEGARDSSGEHLALGDLTGDGLDDAVIAATRHDGGANNAGAIYILHGPLTSSASLAEAEVRLYGEDANDFAGSNVDVVGDFDGDGVADLLVGAIHQDSAAADSGTAYVLSGPISSGTTLADASARLMGENADDYASYSAQGMGDVTGDGLDDVLIGAPGRDWSIRSEGAAYLVAGGTTGDLSLANAHATFRGEQASDQAGQVSGRAGDVDGDGTADLLIASPKQGAAGDDAGAIWVLFGPATGVTELSTQPGKWVGESAQDLAGWSVAGGGDLDGDGLADVAVGAYHHAGRGTDAGAAYVLFGATLSP